MKFSKTAYAIFIPSLYLPFNSRAEIIHALLSQFSILAEVFIRILPIVDYVSRVLTFVNFDPDHIISTDI